MQVVSRPEFPPGQCIVNLSDQDPGGFIDTGLTPPLVDPRVYVSRQAVIDMGRHFGFPTPEEFIRLISRVDQLEEETEGLKVENRNLMRDLDAAEWTLERKFQSKPSPKPGRPRKVTVNG